MLSFRKDTLTSVKEESTEYKMDEKMKKIKEAEGKTELLLEPASPTKWMESEDGSDLAKKYPPFHEQEESEPKLFSRGIKPLLNFRKHIRNSFKEESTEVETDESKTEKKGEDEKKELSSKQEFLEKDMESEEGSDLAKTSPPLHEQKESEPKLFSRGIKPLLSFRKHIRNSFKEESTKVETDENKTEKREEDEKKELSSKQEFLEKDMESEDGSDLAKTSPPLHEQEESEPKLFSRDIKPLLSFRKHIRTSFKEESTKVETDENETEKREEDEKKELSSKQEFLEKDMESEDGSDLAKTSPPFHEQEESEPKLFSRGIKPLLSFRKHIRNSFKEESTEVETDENKTEKRGEDEKKELSSKQEFLGKDMESEDVNGLSKKSLPVHEQKENEPKLFSRGVKPFKEESTEAEMDENKTEKKENGKIDLSLKQEFLVKNMESENSNFLSTPSLISNNPGNNEPKSPNNGLKAMLSFRSKLVSVKVKTTGDAGISKHFSVRYLKRIKDSDQIKEENNRIPKKNVELEGETDVLKELLSVMEIVELIQKRQLLEAFRNIRCLVMELLAEGKAKQYEENPKEYTMKVKDVNMLYDSICKEIQQIVEKTLDLPRLEVKGLIIEIVALIEEEEKIYAGAINIPVPADPMMQLGLARNWRNLWKRTVKESVQRRINKVPIPLKEDNASWLSVYLGFLRTVIKEDLLTIVDWVQKFYPRDFNVCATYLMAFQEALASRLQRILEEEESYLKLNQFHALLHWVTNIYYSENCLGHPDLRPEIKTEDLPSLLPPDVMDRLKNGYIHSLKLEIKSRLEKILHLEHEKWNSEVQLEALQSPYHSTLSFDIQLLIGQYVKTSRIICSDLERAALEITIKEATDFMPCFGKAFLEWDNTKDSPQFASLMVDYVNNFHNMRTDLQRTFNINSEEMETTLADLTLRYKKRFFNKLKQKTQPMFKKILSHAWMLHSGTLDLFITKILLIVEDFSKDLKNLMSPMGQDFLSEVHKYVVKEYITQILKPRGRMRKIKREEVSNIMYHEAKAINNTMKDLGSSADWLFPAILYIANIIGEKKKDKIKEYIKELSQDYPDIRKEHILAILALRGLRQNKRKAIVDQMDGSSKELEFGFDNRLFAEIELSNIICCY